METAGSDLARIARRRLYPSLREPNYLVLRSRRLILQRWFQALPSNQLTVLDIGGRYQPYRPLIAGRIKHYWAVDLIQTPLVNAIADGEQLPFAAGAFDLVIATEVFQYFARPAEAAKEIWRVLARGGALCLSVPSFAPRFVDEERWRFTPAGLQAVLRPYSSVEIVPEVFSAGGFLRAVNLSLNTFAKFAAIRALFHWTAVPLLNALALVIERAALSRNDQFAGNYSVLAIK